MSQVLDPLKVRKALARSTCGMTAADVQGMADSYARGYSCATIGGNYGINGDTVWRLLVASGVTMRKPGQQSIYTPELVQSIKDLRASGLTWEATAAKAGVSISGLLKARDRGDV